MKTIDNEIMILYDSASHVGSKTLAYAHTISPNVKSWDYSLLPLTCAMWQQLLGMLQLHPKELLDKSHPYYQTHIQGHYFDQDGWLNMLRQNTFLIKWPILVNGNKAIMCTTPESIYRILQGAVQLKQSNGPKMGEPGPGA
jgi:arsenate reductase